MPVGFAGPIAPRTTTTNVDDLFDTRPAPVPARPAPATISSELKHKLLGRIQEERIANHGYPPKLLGAGKADQLKTAIANGDAVEVRINQNLTAVLKKADDLEQSTSFFYKTTGGFAGTQFYGPFDV